MKATIVKKSRFDSAHKNPGFGEGHKCNRIHGHGFEYEVAVSSEINPETGLSLDLGILKDIMKKRVDNVLDHYYLNEDIPHFKDVPPSAENIAIFIFKEVEKGLRLYAHQSGIYFNKVPKVKYVRLDETPTSTVIISEEDFHE